MIPADWWVENNPQRKVGTMSEETSLTEAAVILDERVAAIPVANLTARDRCDECHAQAYVRVVFDTIDGSSLDFCGHHWKKYSEKLCATAFVVYDNTRFIDSPKSDHS